MKPGHPDNLPNKTTKQKKEEKRANIVVNGLFLLTLVYIGKVQELLGPLSKISLGKIAIAVSLLLYFASPSEEEKVNLSSISQVKYIAAIYFFAVLSIPFSVWPGRSFQFVFLDFSKTLIFIFLIIKVIHTAEDLKKLNWALILAAFILSFFSLVSGKTGRISVTGTYDPNDLAMILVMILPMVYFFAGSQPGVKRLGLYMIVAVIILGIMKTVSRGGFLGLLTVGLLILFRDTQKKLVAKIAIIIALGGMFYFLAPDNYWQRIETMIHPENDYNVTTSAGRVEIWKRGLQLMMEHPFVGSGAGAFTVAEGETHADKGGKWSTAHNSFIQIGVEMGVGGLLLLLMLIFGSVRSLGKIRKRMRADPVLEGEYLWLVNGIEVSLFTFCVPGFFLSQAYSNLLFFLFANVIVLRKLELSGFNTLGEDAKDMVLNSKQM